MPVARAETHTFLFTDIEGSTRLLRSLGDAYPAVLEDHRRLLRNAFAAHGGEEQGTEGDSFFVVFPSAGEAVHGAIDGQLALAEYASTAPAPIRVRMGIHTGDAIVAFGGFIGLAVHEAARVAAVGHGGQILVSHVTRQLADRLPPEVGFRELGEHRLKDIDGLVRLHQVLHPALADRFPPLRTLEMLPGNLPTVLTSFVGRGREVAEASELLGRSRLVTLTGPGGIGKTRLAQEVAAAVAIDFPGGIWWVELASVDDGERVAGAVVAAVGLREEPGRSPVDSFVDWAGGRRMLVVLDNCEHVLDASAALALDLLAADHSLTVLTTTREPLSVPGEATYRVPPMATPTTVSSIEELQSWDAVRLFLERANAARPGFAVADADAGMLADICRRLDGVPLAIELAAARVTALSLGQLDQRLDDRFRLVNVPRRGAPARHQTLRAVIDWSHDLLTASERVVLRRLAAFAGSFTLDAAEDVVADASGGITARDVLDVLARLVDRSLLLFEQKDGPRYRLLESIRQYAAEQLQAAGEEAEIRRRHLAWYSARTERAAEELRGPEQATGLGSLVADLPNLRAALAWGLGREGRGPAAPLAAALGRFWLVRGYWSEGRSWRGQALEEASDAGVRIRLLNAAAALAAVQGDYTVSRTLCAEALLLAARAGDEQGAAEAHLTLGVAAWSTRDLAAARSAFEESLARSRAAGDQHGEAAALSSLGGVAWASRDVTGARRLLEESLAIRQRLDDEHGTAVALNNLAVLATAEGEPERARTLSEESLRISREHGDTEGVAAALDNLAEACEAQGDLVTARALAEESLTLGRQLGDRRGAALSYATLGRVARAAGDHRGATRSFGAAATSYLAVGDEVGAAEALVHLAEVAADEGRMVDAARLLATVRRAVDPDAPPEGLDAAIDRCRAALGPGAFDAAVAGAPVDLAAATAAAAASLTG